MTGTACIVRNVTDLFMEEEARPFIDKPCHIVKVLKSGMIQVSLDRDPTQVYSVPRRCLELPAST